MNRRTHLGVSMVLALACVLPATAARFEDSVGLHTVRSGETLSSITRQYLGDQTLWRENWRLNPDIDNPNLLVPGQQLTVIVERKVIAESAAVAAVENRVDKNLRRSSWIPASRGDELQTQDGLRTLARSSAALRFNDNSSLILSEYSQVFLEAKTTDLRGNDTGRVEVEQGVADLFFAPINQQLETDIEIITGDAVARPESDRNGNGELRTSLTEATGAAQFMVYTGATSVAAAGAQVTVREGEGTRVEVGKPPLPPEKLLPAPSGLLPASGATWVAANQRLQWQSVPGAQRYVVEICRDQQCNELLQKATVADSLFDAELFDTGTFSWRVRAVSGTDLEGYPSPANEFTLTTTALDSAPPVVAVFPEGAARVQPKTQVLIGPQTVIHAMAWDDAAGVDAIEYQADDGTWQNWPEGGVQAGSIAQLRVRATDNFGKTSPVLTVSLKTAR